MLYNDNDIKKYVASFKNDKDDVLTYEKILTSCIITTKHLVLDIEDLENLIIESKSKNLFTLLIIGAKLENIRLEIENLYDIQK